MAQWHKLARAKPEQDRGPSNRRHHPLRALRAHGVPTTDTPARPSSDVRDREPGERQDRAVGDGSHGSQVEQRGPSTQPASHAPAPPGGADPNGPRLDHALLTTRRPVPTSLSTSAREATTRRAGKKPDDFIVVPALSYKEAIEWAAKAPMREARGQHGGSRPRERPHAPGRESRRARVRWPSSARAQAIGARRQACPADEGVVKRALICESEEQPDFQDG
jgi:hypothetical protein